MSRPVRNLASPPGQRNWTPPEWDPKAVAADYLLEMREAAKRGPLDPNWLDHLNTWLVHELRHAYSPEQAQRAVAHLEPMIARFEQLGRQGPQAAPQPAPQTEPATIQELLDTAANARTEPAQATLPALNGWAMQTSVVPTWCALVAFTWLSLLWGGIVSLPFGVGAAVLGASFAGFIVVPVFASVFGFLGMNAGKNSTLAKLGYKPCPPEHPLNSKAEEFAKALAIPKPEVGTFELFNAFAMGSKPENGTVAMGIPLMSKLTEDETHAILGHEMGHIVSGDMRRMMLMRTFQNTTVWFMFSQGAKAFARWCICWGAELYILAFSRKREFWADAVGAALTSKEAMISALRKLQHGPALSADEGTHARFMIRGRFEGMTSTHPTFEERIEALKQETYMRQLPRV